MKRKASVAALGLAACVFAMAAYAQDAAPVSPAASGTSPVPTGEVGSKPREGSPSQGVGNPKPAEGHAKPGTGTSPAPAGEVGSKPGEGSVPPAPAAAKSSPQHFEPTEKVRPDFDVAFPVDI